MQEVSLAAFGQRNPLVDTAKIAPWLYRVAVRQSLLYRRRQGRHRRLVERFAQRSCSSGRQTHDRDPLDWLLADERRTLVREALQRLSGRDAEILLLKYAENWSYRQLAEHLGVSRSAAEARLHRARDRLRIALGPRNLIEAQCWRQEITTTATPALQLVAGPARTLPVGALPRGARWLPLAASVLVALVLGIVLRDVLPGGGRSAPGPVVDLEVPVRGGPPGSVQKGRAHEGQTARAEPRPARQPSAAGDVPAKADTITFLVHSRDKKRSSRSVQVPLVSAAGLNQNGLELLRPAIHSDVLQRLEQAGHQIRWRRRYAPLQLDDGHRIVFPVDDLEIAPIAHRVF